MEMEFSRVEKVVGTFIIGVTFLLMTTLVIIGRGKDWFETYIPYFTTFNESYNLQENAAVKLFKADIGKVQKITLVKNRVRVKLLILDQYASRIRQDALATVESPTFIGSEYISIIPGSTDAPLIPENGEIPSREKRSLNDIMAEFEVEKTAKMVVKAIQNISDISRKLSDTQGPLWLALENINRISGHMEQITADLNAGKGSLGALLKSEKLLQTASGNLERTSAILKQIQLTMDKAPKAVAMVRDTGESVRTILDDIQKATVTLQVILDDIKAGSTNVPRISTTFRDGIQEIREGVEQINRVVSSMQKNVFIRSNLPQEPAPGNTDLGARP